MDLLRRLPTISDMKSRSLSLDAVTSNANGSGGELYIHPLTFSTQKNLLLPTDKAIVVSFFEPFVPCILA